MGGGLPVPDTSLDICPGNRQARTGQEHDKDRLPAMSQTCTDCSTANRDIARYCKQCGQTLETSTAPALGDFICSAQVHTELSEIFQVMAAMQRSGASYRQRLHTVLLGNTGTGKTMLVNILAKAYFDYGVITRESPVFLDATGYGDFAQDFEKNFRKARGGILCIENVQKLIPEDYSQSIDPLDRLLVEMSKPKNHLDPIIVLSGHTMAMRKYLDANDDARSRFPLKLHLKDFDSEALLQLTQHYLDKVGFAIAPEAVTKLQGVYKQILKNDRRPDMEPEARNSWLALNMAEECEANYYIRVGSSDGSPKQIMAIDVDYDLSEEVTLDSALAKLNALVGMENIKDTVQRLTREAESTRRRTALGHKDSSIGFHVVLTGNPGTGKTTVARLLGELLYAVGVLDLGHVIEVDRAKMVGRYAGSTAPAVHDLCDRAQGGVLFIDEAYTLKQGDNDKFGQEAIDALLKRMEDDRGKFVVVVAGYPGDMTTFLNANTGLQSRFDQRYRFHIDDYTADDLYEIFQRLLAANDFVLEDAAMSKAQRYLRECCELKDKNFGNGREARTLFDSCRSALSNRVCEFPADMPADAPDWNTIIAGDVPDRGLDQGDLASTLDKLDKLVGLKPVKQEIRNLIDYVELSNYRSKLTGMATAPLNLHFVFTGNPGTGKTTVAEELGTIFKAMGILKKGHVVEAKKSDLVGAYLGQTEPTTNQKIDEAMGGVLFIDEAYTLSRDQFGLTAIDTLLTRLEQDRGKFVAIAAGYKDDIQEFLKANAGLADRFTRYIDFPDYSLDELCEIFDRMAAVKGFTVDDVARSRVRSVLTDLYENRDDSFSNARIVRNLFEASTVSQAARLAPLLRNGGEIDHIIAEIAVDDIPASVRGQ